MGGLFSKPKMPTPIAAPPPPPAASEDLAAKEAATKEAERIRKKKGYQSTIKTSEQGIMTTPGMIKDLVYKEKLGE